MLWQLEQEEESKNKVIVLTSARVLTVQWSLHSLLLLRGIGLGYELITRLSFISGHDKGKNQP